MMIMRILSNQRNNHDRGEGTMLEHGEKKFIHNNIFHRLKVKYQTTHFKFEEV